MSQLGYHVVGVNFGSEADDKKKYRHKVTEMWWRMREWIMNGGSIMDDPQLERELTEREYWHNDKDQLVLQSKKDMQNSPDWGDALARTFAFPVPKRENPRGMLDSDIGTRYNLDKREYDPMDAMDIEN
jgi:hypothetical protein